MFLHVVCCAIALLSLGNLSAEAAICPDGWQVHEEMCYLFKMETYNWFDAKTTCEIMGGHLAEDTSGSIHQFLNGMVQAHAVTDGYTWIGLQDMTEENVFVWTSSGQQASPTFWGPGEPQDQHNEEDCVALHNAGWIDANCEDAKCHFLCQKALVEDEILG